MIATGGDGTLNEVINGMAGRDNLPPLGIFPLGTTNDFARALGISKNWEEYCDLVIRGETRPIDVGKANDRYFINIAGGGTLTELTYEVPSKLKTMIGPGVLFEGDRENGQPRAAGAHHQRQRSSGDP